MKKITAKISGMKKTRSVSVKRGRGRGRPISYKAAFVEQARRLALLGQTDVEMAAFFGVAESTFHLWKQRHLEFSESLREGKAEADSRVAEALYNASIGERTVTDVREKTNTDGGIIERTTEVKEILPNVSAMIHWLRNRVPAKWRDQDQIDENMRLPSAEVLQNLYDEKMRVARERQQAILVERGLLVGDGDDPSE
jgi:hypothetical protein